MMNDVIFEAEYFTDQKKREKILHTKKHVLLQNCLKYVDQKSQLSKQYMIFI